MPPTVSALALALALAVASALALPARAETGLEITEAWTPAQAGTGVNAPVYMTITNAGAPDAILRVRCPVANFTEKRTMDRGEGAPSSREVRSIPVPTGKTVLQADGSYVLLLQTREALAAGGTFDCTVAFQGAGNRPVTVRVVQN